MNILRRIRRWFIDRYLPAYVNEVNKEDIESLQTEITALRQALVKERAYSAGLQYACKRKVIIQIDK